MAMQQVRTEAQTQKEALLVPSNPSAQAQMVSVNATNRMHSPSDLVALASYVQTADNYTKATVGGKLELISDQIRALQAQARRVLEDAKRDVELNHAKCNFKRVPGRIYHLYRRSTEQADGEERIDTYFSMLSPAEWGGAHPDEFLESYRLEHDMSWTPFAQTAARDARRNFDADLLGVQRSDATQLSLTMT